MLLRGQKAIPQKALKNGFKFRYSFLETAMISILSSDSPKGL
jgi:NAD dependent epimerase/dehydratase family enzyme